MSKNPPALTIGASAVTMTSREIADLTGKQHQHVRRDIEKMLAELGEDASKFGRIYRDGLNRDQQEYALDRELTETLLTGYNAVARRKVIARWHELEARPIVLDDPVSLRAALLGYTEKVIALEATVKAQAPKVEYADALLHADGTTLVRDVAKALGVGVRALEKALRDKGVILANNAPAATYVAKGYFKEATHPFETKTRGTQISHTARVTGKGIEFIRRFVRRHSDLLGAKQGAV